MKKLIFALLFLLSLNLFAQEKMAVEPEDYENEKVEMADQMRQSGKIYVVVAVIAIIFLGIVVYTVALDRKIGRLEKELKETKEGGQDE